MALISGTRLGPYEILALVGAGGMGEVYRARDTQLGRDVAIKVLANLSPDPEQLRRFEQEARAAAALNHPNILAVHQMGTYEAAQYLVSELLEGETLRKQIKRGRLPVRKAIDYGVQIAHGLAAAHEKGIVHRDLKPENLFVTNGGRVKILDFGLAKLTQPREASQIGASTLTAGTEPGMVLGTVGYMAPEQVRGQAADARSDIFAFGAILYEMLAGRRAFKAATAADTQSAILKEDPAEFAALPVKVPPALERVVRRCLEKMPEQRFQSALDLGFALEAVSDSGVALEGAAPVQDAPRSWGWVAGAVAIVLGLGFLLWWRTPPPVPQVENVAQLTDDREPKATFSALASDGSRVYFNEGQSGGWRVGQGSVAGGDTAPVNTSIADPILTGIAPDSSALLTLAGSGDIRAGQVMADLVPLWLVALPAGNPRAAGDLKTCFAEYFPDGQHIVYAGGTAIFTADSDGSNSHKLADMAGSIEWPSVSPDGKHIRFTVIGDNLSLSLWEIAADGSGQRELLKDRQESSAECCGKWTADGRYFIFMSLRLGRWDLWALPEGRSLFHGSARKPVQLTSGPLSYYQPFPSRNGKTVFAIGSKQRGELIRYDAKRKEFVPFLAGISATDAMPSRDGEWVVYLSYPEHTLWRSRLDGSDRLQLTYSPLRAVFPHISPDGTRVAFGSWNRKLGFNAYVVSMQGGASQKIVQDAESPTWSPDGNYLVFETGSFEIYTIDLRTGKTSKVPGSGKTGPFWPTQDSLVAASEDGGKLLLFDFKTQKWSELATGPFINWFPSWDGKYLYCEKSDSSGSKAFRIRLSDGHMEPVADLSGVRRVEDENWGTWLGVASDGSLLLTRNVGIQEIYAINVRWP